MVNLLKSSIMDFQVRPYWSRLETGNNFSIYLTRGPEASVNAALRSARQRNVRINSKKKV